ncbi:MAG: hypothetical protein WC947_07405 [Elusimicrobiota bacterium]
MRLTKKQRENIAKVLFNFSQIVFAATIVGRIISSEKVPIVSFITGLILVIIFLIIGIVLDKGE